MNAAFSVSGAYLLRTNGICFICDTGKWGGVYMVSKLLSGALAVIVVWVMERKGTEENK